MLALEQPRGFENQFHGKTFAEQLRAVEEISAFLRSLGEVPRWIGCMEQLTPRCEPWCQTDAKGMSVEACPQSFAD